MPSRRGKSWSSYGMYFFLTCALFPRVRGWLTGLALEQGVEVRSPLFDQRIVRFAASRPRWERRSGRDTWLSFLLVALLGGAVVFFLNLVSLGVFFYVIVAVVGIMAVGFLHYVLWGYSLSEELAEQMQQERLKQQREIDESL